MVWFLLDVALLMYYTDCSGSNAQCSNKGESTGGEKRSEQKPGGLLDKILPRGKSRYLWGIWGVQAKKTD